MRAGTLNRRVIVQQLAAGQDSIGQPVTTWSTFCTVWANVAYVNGVETIKGGAATSAAKASIRIRRRTDITSGMRVQLGTTNFNIQAVLPDEQDRQHMDLACEVIS